MNKARSTEGEMKLELDNKGKSAGQLFVNVQWLDEKDEKN